MKKIILLLVMLFFIGYSGFGQARPCPPGSGMVPCGPNHTCLPRGDCKGGPNPPPPGLVVPIDNHLSLLLAAGLCFGIYFFVSSGKKSTSAN